MSEYDDLVAALSPVSVALTKLGIRHYVGGSVASSFHGASRSTMDVDIVADMTDSAVSEFLCGIDTRQSRESTDEYSSCESQ